MKNWILPLALISTLLSTASYGNDEYDVFGFPQASCGSWTTEQTNESTTSLQYESWVLGWVSAAGWAGIKIKETDPYAIIQWINNYCQSNPLEKLTSAVKKLIYELEE